MIASIELQPAVISRLKTDEILRTSLLGGIHDGSAPASVQFPYVTVGEWIDVNKDGCSYIGRMSTFLVHVFSRYEGSKEATVIATRIGKILHQAELVTPSWFCVKMRFESAETLVETYEVRHLAMRFRVESHFKAS